MLSQASSSILYQLPQYLIHVEAPEAGFTASTGSVLEFVEQETDKRSANAAMLCKHIGSAFQGNVYIAYKFVAKATVRAAQFKQL